MSAPHIILDRLPSFCKNYQIWWKFDVVITNIILLVFLLRHGVVTVQLFEPYCINLCSSAMRHQVGISTNAQAMGWNWEGQEGKEG